MHRIFVPKDQIPVITGSDVHHIRDVLRMKAGDQLELLDGEGTVYLSQIEKIEKDKVTCRIVESRKSIVESRIKIALAQALPKAGKMDFITEKCTELGVNKIIPMLTERTIGKAAKPDRWHKIAKSAAEQSGRAVIPEITGSMKFEEVLKMRGQFDLALIPWELEKEKTLKQVLKDFQISQSPNLQTLISRYPKILFMVGPEGGFSQKEVELAKEAGFTSISLGKRILRTETAGMAILAAIMYELS